MFVFGRMSSITRRFIDAAKTCNLEAKTLAAQVFPRFFKDFPKLSAPALNAFLDLVKTEDPKVFHFLSHIDMHMV